MIDTAFSRRGHGLQSASSLDPADCLQAELVNLAHGTQARHTAHWDFGPVSLAGAELGIFACRHSVETNKDAF